MTQNDIIVIKCSQCKDNHELGYMKLHDIEHDKYYCFNCCMTVTYLREALEELNDTTYVRDVFTDPELAYAQRRRMTDRENRILNDSWIKAHWRIVT